MSFETHITDHIAALRKKAKDLRYKQLDLVHDCDCEYCEYQGDVTEDNQDAYDDLEKQIKETHEMIERVKAHAKLHKIELPEEATK